MKSLTAILVAAAALFATLPGIATLNEQLEAPPNYHIRFATYLLIIGVLTLLILSLWRKRFEHIARKRLVAMVVICLVIALAAFTAHDEVYARTVFQDTVSKDTTNQTFDTVTVFFPLRLNGRLKEWADSAGGRTDIWKKDYHSIRAVAAETERYSRTSTVLLLLLLRVASILPFVIAFAVSGWAVAGRMRTSR